MLLLIIIGFFNADIALTEISWEETKRAFARLFYFFFFFFVLVVDYELNLIVAFKLND